MKIDVDFVKQIENIKKDIISTRNKVLSDANRELINMYYRIGKIISENQKYGSNFINALSNALKSDFPDTAGFSPRNLARMKKFYEAYKEVSILPPAVANLPTPLAKLRKKPNFDEKSSSNLPTPLAKLPWSFNCLLLDKVDDSVKRIWYASKCIENSWNYVVLNHQIELDLYSRQADSSKKLTNFDRELSKGQSELAIDIVKDPYIFELVGLGEKSKEIDIEKAMIEKIKNVLLEFGKGFSFIGNQYLISTDNKDYYIDLLFYHLKLRCYVVIELKTTDFDPSFIGQLQFYTNAVDRLLKTKDDNKTIGLLLCKSKDKVSVEWSLESSNAPIGVTSYKVRALLPTEEELKKCLK